MDLNVMDLPDPFDCPYCGFYIEEAEYWRYGVGDKIKCPNCSNICIKDIDEAYTDDWEDIGYYYLRKPLDNEI